MLHNPSYDFNDALLPIGAYYPDSFRHVHMGPDEAIKAFADLRARWLVRPR